MFRGSLEIHRGDAVYLRGMNTRRVAIAEVLAAWPRSSWSRIRLATPENDEDAHLTAPLQAGDIVSVPKSRLEVVRV